MQVDVDSGRAGVLQRALRDAAPDERGRNAWRAFMRAHASLMRELSVDLTEKVGLSLGDFDVLAQLAFGGGELRVTELANRVFSSRSALTRRLDRMVDEGVVSRSKAEADARGVVIGLTETGEARLLAALPPHLEAVSALFSSRLSDEELEVLERALNRVTLDCSFG